MDEKKDIEQVEEDEYEGLEQETITLINDQGEEVSLLVDCDFEFEGKDYNVV